MQVDQLSFKHHPNAPYFFRNLSFRIEANKIHALHGKNGMGKTILLNLLSKNVPSHGVMEGRVVGAEKAVLVNQRFDLMIADQFSFQDNLKFACMSHFPSPLSSLKQPHFYPDFLERFNIDASQPVKKLSGGQRQILAFLMVLQKKSTVLLLDEPTATLDEQNTEIVFDFLQTLTLQGMTILIVCHDNRLINRYTTGCHFYIEMGSNLERTLSQYSP